MTLLTTLTETPGCKLISLVRGRYGWNGPSRVRWVVEGQEPRVTLNPDGDKVVLSVKTWRAET